jgi:hypothetical protein
MNLGSPSTHATDALRYTTTLAIFDELHAGYARRAGARLESTPAPAPPPLARRRGTLSRAKVMGKPFAGLLARTWRRRRRMNDRE